MAAIHTLPPELHAHIGYLSCLGDTGFTIGSLSRVSKYFNAVARPYLFHTVSATGTHKTALLGAALQKHAAPSPSSAGSQVESMYLGITQPPSPSEREPLASAIHRILVMSSTSLRTLTLDLSGALQDSSVVFARVFRMPFPALEDLTLVGFYPNPTIPSRPPSPQSSLPPSPTFSQPPSPSSTRPVRQSIEEEESEGSRSNFPEVKRLHLSGNRNPSGLFGVGSLAKVFPGLEELKVSGLSMAVGFAVEVEDALRLSFRIPHPLLDEILTQTEVGEQSTALASMERYLRAFAPQLPPRLRVLRVQPGLAVEWSTGLVPNMSAVMKDGDMMGRFREMEAVYGRGGQADTWAKTGGDERVRFELVERGKVGHEEVWEGWRSGLSG